MRIAFTGFAGTLLVGAMLLVPAQAKDSGKTESGGSHSHSHSLDHSHSHETAAGKEVYKGYFKDEQIEARSLTDWEGDWQSVYPYLLDGTLDPVMAHKAEHGDKSAQEYRAYYETGYKTDVFRIVISGNNVTFHREDGVATAQYASDGYEILTYKKGNRGVRFIFKKTAGDDLAPQFIQFSDHRIAPSKADHYHLYWGSDRAEILKELTNWPTYYPASLNGKQIVEEMTAH